MQMVARNVVNFYLFIVIYSTSFLLLFYTKIESQRKSSTGSGPVKPLELFFEIRPCIKSNNKQVVQLTLN